MGGADGVIRLWAIGDKGEGHVVQELRGHTGVVFSVCALGDGMIASGGSDNAVKVWDTIAARNSKDYVVGSSSVYTANIEHSLTTHTNYVKAVVALKHPYFASA